MSAPRVIAIIPARMAASRFPGKPLAPLLGRPMIQHVYERTAACPAVDAVWIATCDDSIRVAAESFGANVKMTSRNHVRATSRVAEAVLDIPGDIVVMVQGDEPMVEPGMITAAVKPMLDDRTIACVNLCAKITTQQELLDPNTIKVAVARNGDALYFSRSVVPSQFRGDAQCFKQVCICPFRRDALERFVELPEGPLELAESVDMLRFLENGIPVRMVPTDHRTHAVDVPADLEEVARLVGLDHS